MSRSEKAPPGGTLRFSLLVAEKVARKDENENGNVKACTSSTAIAKRLLMRIWASTARTACNRKTAFGRRRRGPHFASFSRHDDTARLTFSTGQAVARSYTEPVENEQYEVRGQTAEQNFAGARKEAYK